MGGWSQRAHGPAGPAGGAGKKDERTTDRQDEEERKGWNGEPGRQRMAGVPWVVLLLSGCLCLSG